ncbi:MAG: coproporphyrinogen-III oxidase family protein [Planctomycetota bacterium]|jgi:oxygen-independent coproporphyrinogen-3 oxidase|nr:coproporphyrinogen-III oxidase family protein [Planctomycetota bacterium]MEC7447900.1 coproporphyrinogen-III oxidase family protein [Planctomycetota bacterium]MEC7499597.1 coproporphyrinogen-III oxidase family protein [Planctomycetota bacterium]MEC7718837.1 coproporphyrinogen-III oxidase family protein [Planctomycetota bacterium]MEC7977396.1 coproporphyrinogen-III oxidase family protein [Planctomycetota bacterium]
MTTESSKTEVGSYFISNYPPYSQWKKDALDELRSAMKQSPADVPLGLYLHIPFCRKRCKFCYFKVFTDNRASDIETYVSALSKEIELVSQLPVMGERPFRFVYFGGGTPSYLSVRQLESLVGRLRQSIDWNLAEEVTFECEPGTLKESKVRALKDLGVTRLSLGVENFSDEVLKENGRAHLTAEIDQAWTWIQDADFHNVNIDLIAGMVGETRENWEYNIRRAIELSPDSVTIYQLELPYNTVYSKDILGNQVEIPVADWPTKRDWVSYAFDEFLKAGYHVNSAYTVVKDPEKVNFSYRDNLWHGSDLLATGIASFGHVSGVHYQNKPEWDDYVGDLLERNELPLGRAFEPTSYQLLIREMILQLKKGRISANYFQEKFDVDILQEWSEVWGQYSEDGFVEIDGREIRLTRGGLLRADGLLSAFFESHHQGVRYT